MCQLLTAQFDVTSIFVLSSTVTLRPSTLPDVLCHAWLMPAKAAVESMRVCSDSIAEFKDVAWKRVSTLITQTQVLKGSVM